MRILAIHAGMHDSSAAAFDDYELVAAVSEERLTRVKGSGEKVPWLAIDEVLRIAGWSRNDVDAIAMTRGFSDLSLPLPAVARAALHVRALARNRARPARARDPRHRFGIADTRSCSTPTAS